MASARKTAVSDTTWYRKLITASASERWWWSEEVAQLEDEIVPPLGHHGEVRLPHRGHGDRRRHRGDRGEDEQQQRGAGDALPVQPADALGVDQLAADLEPGQEGGRHPAAALVQELDEVGVRADRDDQRRAL